VRASYLCLALLLAACGHTTKRSPPMADQEPLDEQEQRGRIAFMKYCNTCHPQGEGGIGGTLNNKPFLPETAIKIKVRTGLGLDMPRFGEEDITPAELDDIVEYVSSIRANDPVADNPEKIKK